MGLGHSLPCVCGCVCGCVCMVVCCVHHNHHAVTIGLHFEECSSSHHATRSIELGKVRIACLAHADRVFTGAVLGRKHHAVAATVVAEQLSTAATVVLQHDDEHGQHRRRGVPCDTYRAAGEHCDG